MCGYINFHYRRRSLVYNGHNKNAGKSLWMQSKMCDDPFVVDAFTFILFSFCSQFTINERTPICLLYLFRPGANVICHRIIFLRMRAQIEVH